MQIPMDIRQLLQQPESEWLDFKQKHHDNSATFLHDVLCLSNAYAENDRFLVFGVGDDRQLHGVATDDKRKTNANVQDFLRGANLNRIPTCRLESHEIGGVTIDVLTIKNRPDKPFYVTKDYDHHGERVRNGVVYTRLGDTNIPKKECAPEDHVELMWRERFGLGLSPLERVERLLDRPDDWIKIEGDAFLYHRQFPEFTIVDGETLNEKFIEAWTKLYPDKSARSFEVQLRYLSTMLERFTFVACDGERYRIPLPEPVRTGPADWKYIIHTSTTAWKLALIYRQYYPLDDPYALPGVELVY
jgi:hypothetical protein